jgi:pyruvate dehydrogenase (quinone)
VICVLNNRDLNQVTWEQRVVNGDPKLEASQNLPPFDYAAYARLIGLHGIRVERPEDVGPAWDDALAAGRPAVLDVVTDPEVPPLPPHIRAEQAKELASALRQGDPAMRDIIRHAVAGKLAEFTTR